MHIPTTPISPLSRLVKPIQKEGEQLLRVLLTIPAELRGKLAQTGLEQPRDDAAHVA